MKAIVSALAALCLLASVLPASSQPRPRNAPAASSVPLSTVTFVRANGTRFTRQVGVGVGAAAPQILIERGTYYVRLALHEDMRPIEYYEEATARTADFLPD